MGHYASEMDSEYGRIVHPFKDEKRALRLLAWHLVHHHKYTPQGAAKQLGIDEEITEYAIRFFDEYLAAVESGKSSPIYV